MLENVLKQRVDSELESRIRARAYEIYESRGCLSGRDLQDWFDAEREVFRDLQYPPEIALLRSRMGFDA